MSDKHLFSLFFADLPKLLSGLLSDLVVCRDKNLVIRLKKVLRLRPGQRVILFDDHQNAVFLIVEVGEKISIKLKLELVEKNQVALSKVDLFVGLLKKNNFERVVDVATQLGVSRVVPLLSEKNVASWLHEKESQRLEKISLASREQAKNFLPMTIEQPRELSALTDECEPEESALKILFDCDGMPFKELVAKVAGKKYDLICVAIGSEAGFSQEEVSGLQGQGFVSCRLTTTTLRATEAVTVGLGLVKVMFAA